MGSCASSAPSPTLSPTTFDWGDCLGKGGAGEVLRVRLCGGWESHSSSAHQTSETVTVSNGLAAKRVSKQLVLKTHMEVVVMVEVEIWRSIRHKNLLKLHATFQDADFLYYITPYCPCGDLGRLILKEGALGEEVVRYVAISLSAALSYLHDREIIHRDVKPGNVFVDEYGGVVLGDFGISRRLDRDGDCFEASGTRSYSAPEVSCRSHWHMCVADMYSLGVTLFEALTGHRPYSSRNSSIQILAMLSKHDKEIAGLDEEVGSKVVWRERVRKAVICEEEREIASIPAVRRFRDSQAAKGAAEDDMDEAVFSSPLSPQHLPPDYPNFLADLQATGASEDCVSFIRECLIANPMWRLTSHEAKRHQWLRGIDWTSLDTDPSPFPSFLPQSLAVKFGERFGAERKEKSVESEEDGNGEGFSPKPPRFVFGHAVDVSWKASPPRRRMARSAVYPKATTRKVAAPRRHTSRRKVAPARDDTAKIFFSTDTWVDDLDVSFPDFDWCSDEFAARVQAAEHFGKGRRVDGEEEGEEEEGGKSSSLFFSSIRSSHYRADSTGSHHGLKTLHHPCRLGTVGSMEKKSWNASDLATTEDEGFLARSGSNP